MRNKMRQLRFFQKKTLGDLWLSTKINQAKLSQLEREIFEPTKTEMEKIAKALKTPIKDVFPEA